MRFVIFCGVGLMLGAMPFFASAQFSIVPQCGAYCQMCDFVQLADNIIDFLITLAGIIGALMFAWAGLLMVTARGDVGQIGTAKGIFMNVVIGLVILLTAWLIVDTIMKTLAGSQAYGMWREIECVDDPARHYGNTAQLVEPIAYVNASGQTETAQIVQGPKSSPSGGGCADCVEVSSSVASCKSGANCQVSAAYYEKLKNLSGGIEITEGYPPTRIHKAKCHTTGYCTDVVFADRTWNTQRINAFISEADAAGFRAVYEPPTNNCSGITACVPVSKTGATGSHFSLYLKE